MLGRYLLKRVVLTIPTALLVSVMIFALVRIIPGDVATIKLVEAQSGSTVFTEERLSQIRSELGLDRPLVIQYLDWVAGVIRLDFGRSFLSRRSVMEDLGPRIPVTLELSVLALLISVILAVPMGAIGAVRRGTWVDYAVRTLSTIGLAVPSFWLGVLVLLALAVLVNWVPVAYVAFSDDPIQNLKHMLLPAAVLGGSFTALLTRITRSSVLEELGQDYVRTARSKGILERIVWTRHVLRNALIPIVTVTGLRVSTLLGGSVIVERIFVLPGIGNLLVDTVVNRDYAATQGIIVLLAVAIIVVNLGVDLIYAMIDPRIRYA